MRLGHLPHQREAIAVEQFAPADDQRIEPRPVEKLHDEELLVLGRQAVLQGGDDERMVERAGNLSFARLVEPFESGVEGIGLVAIEDLEANDLIGLAIAGHVEVAHRARDRLA